MLSCLSNYVALRGVCVSESPRSAMYINDHPAVKISRLESLTTEDEATIADVWNKIQERSSNRFDSDLRVRMSGFLKGKGIIQNATTGYYKEPQELISDSTNRRGIYIEFDKYINIALNVVTVHLWLQISGSVTIKIHDANTGAEIFTFDFDGLAGYNTFFIDKNFSGSANTKRFVISYQSQDTQSARLWSSIIDSGCDCSCDHSGIIIRGAEFTSAEQLVKANADFGNESFGMIVDFNLVCSIADFICQHRDDLKQAWLDLLAIEFLNEAYHSDRINAFLLYNDRDEIKKIQWGDDKMKGLEEIYISKLDGFIQNVRPDYDGICFECDHPYNVKTQIP